MCRNRSAVEPEHRMRLRWPVLLLAAFALSAQQRPQPQSQSNFPPPPAEGAGGCLGTRDFESDGPQSDAAKQLADTRGDALFDTLSSKPGPAVATGWSLKQARARYPLAKLRIRDGAFGDYVRWVELVQAGVPLFAVDLTADGETPLSPESLAETAPENRVVGIETSNPRFRTAAGVRPGMAVPVAQQKAGPAMLVQIHGISGADSYGEFLQFGKAAPADLFFSRYRFLGATAKSKTISWNRLVGPNAPQPCDIHWTRDIRPGAHVKTVQIVPNWAEVRP